VECTLQGDEGVEQAIRYSDLIASKKVAMIEELMRRAN